MRLAPAEVNDLAAAVCLIAFLVPLLQMLLLSAWLAVVVLKFRLMQYGWRRGRLLFSIAALHALTSLLGALFSQQKNQKTQRGVLNNRYRLEPITADGLDPNASQTVVLIPGTWDTSDSIPEYFLPLVEAAQTFSPPVSLFVFKWPSINDAETRSHAAGRLAEAIKSENSRVKWSKVLLLGYSHGGTIATLTSDLLSREVPISVILASTPTILVGDERASLSGNGIHAESPNDLLLAQLQISDSARRRQFALTQLLRRKLNAGLKRSMIIGSIRMLVLLAVLSFLPNLILLALHVLRDNDPSAIPANVSFRQIMWTDFILFGTLFTLWFKNPVVENVYRMLRQALFFILFSANSPIFSLLFGVKYSDVMGYRFRLRLPKKDNTTHIPNLSVLGAHRGVLSSQILVETMRSSLR